MPELGKEAGLTVEVEDGQLVIRIGVGTLAFRWENCEENNPFIHSRNDFKRLWKVTKPEVFARDVRIALCAEGEDGSTPVTKLLDAACLAAIEDGSDGVRELRRG